MEKDLRLLSDLNDIKDTRAYEYFISTLEELKTQLVICSEEGKFKTLQGKAQAYSEIIKDIESAYEDMQAMRKPKADMSKAF